MWYSSQKITKTRTSSRAASAAACSGDRIASEASSPGGGWPSADTNLNDCTVCGDAVFFDLEVVGGQDRHRLAVSIEDRHVDADQVRLGAEHRRLRRRLRRRAPRAPTQPRPLQPPEPASAPRMAAFRRRCTLHAQIKT